LPSDLDGGVMVVRCGGPVSRASTLRSAVPETLPDGSQHRYDYLRLIADTTLNHRPVGRWRQGARGL